MPFTCKNLTCWQWQDYLSLVSTNDTAKEMSSSISAQSKIVISAITQTQGRGRRGRSWVSQSGNLFFSQLMQTDIKISQLVFISSLSLAQVISRFLPKVTVNIKWPNDILLDGKKTCGILIEQSQNAVIIGIGVNLISSPKTPDMMYQTACLKDYDLEVSREEFLALYLKYFDKNYTLCQNNNFAIIRSKWLQYAAFINQTIKVVQGKNALEGQFIGLDEEGLLLLKQSDKVIKISVGDVFV